MCDSVDFYNTATDLCSHHHYLILEHFHHSKKETLYPLAVTPHYFSLSRPRQLLIAFCLYEFAYSGNFILIESQNIWPLCFVPLTQHDVFKFIHVSMYQYFVAFYCCITSHCMDRSHFIYPFFSR